MGRIQGLSESGVLNSSKLLKTGHGYVFQATLSWTGATVGQYCVLRDGTNNAAPVLLQFVVATINGTLPLDFKQGKEFNTGLYFDQDTMQEPFLFTCTYK